MKVRTFILIALVISVLSASAAKSMHSQHVNAQLSLLSSCKMASSLPSPHCGKVPTAIFGTTTENEGILYVVFSQNGHVYLSTSRDNGATYQAPIAVNRVPEAIFDDGENRPKILLGKHHEIFVSWTHKTSGRYSGDVRFARSLDGGASFETAMTVNTDQTLISHRFDALTMDERGHIYLIWIDKRDQIKAQSQNQNYTGAALYYAVSEDSGASFLTNQKLVDHSCECCRIATGNDSKGKVVVLWRHIYEKNIRDHAISYIGLNRQNISKVSDGILHTVQDTVVQQPMRATYDNWQIEGCPHHGPDLSIDNNNVAHLAWFTQGENHKGLMYGQFDLEAQQRLLAISIDGSASASRPQVYVTGGAVYLMWKHFNGKVMELLMRRSHDGGKTWSKNQLIASTEQGSDHPDWVNKASKLFASWHTQTEGFQMISVNL